MNDNDNQPARGGGFCECNNVNLSVDPDHAQLVAERLARGEKHSASCPSRPQSAPCGEHCRHDQSEMLHGVCRAMVDHADPGQTVESSWWECGHRCTPANADVQGAPTDSLVAKCARCGIFAPMEGDCPHCRATAAERFPSAVAPDAERYGWTCAKCGFVNKVSSRCPQCYGEIAAPPVDHDALRLYTPPFRYEHGFIWDATNNMVADNDGQDIALRIRGWGRIGYKPDPEKLQDAVGKLMARALTEFWEKNK